jgi:hypothetical protein
MEISVELLTALGTAAGVFISVLALRSQLKQIEKSIRGSTYQSIANNLLELEKLFIENPELSKIWGPKRSLWYGPDRDLQQTKLNYTSLFIFGFYENLYYQYAQGTIPEDMWTTWRLYLIKHLKQENGFLRQIWDEVQGSYYEKFTEEINNLVKNNQTKA